MWMHTLIFRQGIPLTTSPSARNPRPPYLDRLLADSAENRAWLNLTRTDRGVTFRASDDYLHAISRARQSIAEGQNHPLPRSSVETPVTPTAVLMTTTDYARMSFLSLGILCAVVRVRLCQK